MLLAQAVCIAIVTYLMRRTPRARLWTLAMQLVFLLEVVTLAQWLNG